MNDERNVSKGNQYLFQSASFPGREAAEFSNAVRLYRLLTVLEGPPVEPSAEEVGVCSLPSPRAAQDPVSMVHLERWSLLFSLPWIIFQTGSQAGTRTGQPGLFAGHRFAVVGNQGRTPCRWPCWLSAPPPALAPS